LIKLTLVAIWIILCAILFLSVNIYAIFHILGFNRRTPPPKPIVVPNMSIDEMERIVQRKESSIGDLRNVLEALIARPAIEPKKDGKTGKTAKRALDLVFTMAGHKSMTDALRGDMYSRLSAANPSYAKDFDRAQARR
jgi:hypothetical protein